MLYYVMRVGRAYKQISILRKPIFSTVIMQGFSSQDICTGIYIVRHGTKIIQASHEMDNSYDDGFIIRTKDFHIFIYRVPSMIKLLTAESIETPWYGLGAFD